jgi:hypothetical protein
MRPHVTPKFGCVSASKAVKLPMLLSLRSIGPDPLKAPQPQGSGLFFGNNHGDSEGRMAADSTIVLEVL